MGLSCSRPEKVEATLGGAGFDSRDARQAAEQVFVAGANAGLEALTKLPVVGGIAELLIRVKGKFEELVDAVDEAKEFQQWLEWLDGLLTTLRDCDKIDNSNVRLAAKQATEDVKNLFDFSEHILEGFRVSQHIKVALWKDELKEKRKAVQSAVDNLKLALSINAHNKLSNVEKGIDELKEGQVQANHHVQIEIRGRDIMYFLSNANFGLSEEMIYKLLNILAGDTYAMTTMDDLITLPEEDFNNLMLQVASTVGKAARPKLESAFKQQRGLLSKVPEKGTASLDSNAVGKRLFADDDIFTAAKGGNAARINELLSGDDAVEQVTEVDAKGFTALMRAAQYGRWAVIGNLLDAGADVEATQEDTQRGKGKTALILAASSYQVFNDETSEVEEATTEEDRVKTVKSLCYRGAAKISATDSDGKTARDHASAAGFKAVEKVIDELTALFPENGLRSQRQKTFGLSPARGPPTRPLPAGLFG